MRTISNLESLLVAGGTWSDEFAATSAGDIFWKSMSLSSGLTAGTIAGVPAAIAVILYQAVNYAVVTPLDYVGCGLYSGASYAASGLYSIGAVAGNAAYNGAAGAYSMVRG